MADEEGPSLDWLTVELGVAEGSIDRRTRTHITHCNHNTAIQITTTVG